MGRKGGDFRVDKQGKKTVVAQTKAATPIDGKSSRLKEQAIEEKKVAEEKKAAAKNTSAK